MGVVRESLGQIEMSIRLLMENGAEIGYGIEEKDVDNLGSEGFYIGLYKVYRREVPIVEGKEKVVDNNVYFGCEDIEYNDGLEYYICKNVYNSDERSVRLECPEYLSRRLWGGLKCKHFDNGIVELVIKNRESIKKVFIGVPSGGSESTLFSLLLMNVYEKTRGSVGIEVAMQKVIAPYICRNRNDLVRLAQSEGANFLMFFDNDMLISEDSILRLLKGYDELTEDERGVMCANYVTKSVPARPMCLGFDNNYVYTTPKSPEYERVYKAPTGCMLIPMWVFDKIERPFFHVPPRGEDLYSIEEEKMRSEEGGKELPVNGVHSWYLEYFDWNCWKNSGGEDYWFCHLLHRAGIPVWCDHKLSLDISHLGSYPYSHLDAARKDEYTKKRFAVVGGDSLEYKREG